MTTLEESECALAVGTIHAVVYDQGWWIGEVLKAVDVLSYEMKFMVESGQRYKWLEGKVERVHNNFVLKSSPQLEPCDSSCRFFKLNNKRDIELEYKRYKDLYF